jgi:hypothetical protein
VFVYFWGIGLLLPDGGGSVCGFVLVEGVQERMFGLDSRFLVDGRGFVAFLVLVPAAVDLLEVALEGAHFYLLFAVVGFDGVVLYYFARELLGGDDV